MSDSASPVRETDWSRSRRGAVVEVAIAPEDFALGHTFDTVADLTCEVEEIAGSCERPFPLLRVQAPSLPDVKPAFATDPTVEQSHLLAEFGDERLYQMKWTPEIEALIDLLLDKDGVILSARATGDRWQLRLLFHHNEALSQAYTNSWTDELEITIQEIYDCERNHQTSSPLTPDQEAAVQEAIEHGYYEVPREIELEALASRFDISPQAMSTRLRRGHKSLITDHLSTGEDSPTRSQRDSEQ